MLEAPAVPNQAFELDFVKTRLYTDNATNTSHYALTIVPARTETFVAVFFSDPSKEIILYKDF